jgi:hypothetical protein
MHDQHVVAAGMAARLTFVPVTSVRMSATCGQLMASRATGITFPAYFSGSAKATAASAHASKSAAVVW